MECKILDGDKVCQKISINVPAGVRTFVDSPETKKDKDDLMNRVGVMTVLSGEDRFAENMMEV